MSESYFGIWGETPRKKSFSGIPEATDVRKVMYSTWKYRLGDTIRLRHHMTDIVIYHADGSITLDTGHGDELSRTTCDRYNFFLRGYGLSFHTAKKQGRQLGYVTLRNGTSLPLESPTTLAPEELA